MGDRRVALLPVLDYHPGGEGCAPVPAAQPDEGS